MALVSGLCVGLAAPASASSGPALGPPSSPSAVAGAAGAPAGHAPVTVSWSPPADDPVPSQVTGYTVYRSVSVGDPGSVVGAVAVTGLPDPAHPSYTDNSASGGGTYYYTVTDTANGAESAGATTAAVVAPLTLPSAPLGVAVTPTRSGPTVTAGAASVHLAWGRPADLGGAASATYDVQRSVGAGGPVTIASGVTATAYDDASLPAGHYTYTVLAVTAQGAGPAGVAATADLATRPTAPGVSATAPQDPHLGLDQRGRTVLQWTPPADLGGVTVDHYVVYRGLGDQQHLPTSYTLFRDGVTDTSLVTTPLVAGTGFVSYVVVAVMSGTATSPPSAPATVFVPAAPTVTAVTNPGNGRAHVSASTANLPAGVTVTYAALAYGPGECVYCVTTPVGGGADVGGLGSGTWNFRVVATSSYAGNTAQGPASALSTAAVTLHTTRTVDATSGSDTGDCIAAPCATIGHAIAVATAGDQVSVDSGTYAEGADVVSTPTATVTAPIPGSHGFGYAGLAVTKPLQLMATGAVVIDATGHTHGIVVDSSSPNVVVSGFAVRNANADGIFVFDTDAVRIAGNTLDSNTNGYGLHLLGVTRSSVLDNTVHDNAGGILLTDGATAYPLLGLAAAGNTIDGNIVTACTSLAGIALLGRDGSTLRGGIPPGVYGNTVSDNVSSSNAGPGVLLDAEARGDAVFSNTVTANTMTGDLGPAVVIRARDALAYLDDNAVTNNHVARTGSGTTTGIAVYGVAAHPVAGTTVTGNSISSVHDGVLLSEASATVSGNAFSSVSVQVHATPNAQYSIAGRNSRGHLLVSRGVAGQVTDLGGSLAAGSAPAVATVPTWDANALGTGAGYWTGTLSPLYVARTTAGRIALRSLDGAWSDLPAVTSGGRAVALAGSPAAVGSSVLDNGMDGGVSLLAVATLSTAGDLWLTTLVIGPNRTVTRVARAWRNLGHPSSVPLVGTPALAAVFFTNTAWAAGKNGYLYSLSFDPTTADWVPIGNAWQRRAYRAVTVSAAVSPDGFRTALVLGTPNGTAPGDKLSRLVIAAGAYGRLAALPVVAVGQPGIAVATNGVAVVYAGADGKLRTYGGPAGELAVAVSGVSAAALN